MVTGIYWLWCASQGEIQWWSCRRRSRRRSHKCLRTSTSSLPRRQAVHCCPPLIADLLTTWFCAHHLVEEIHWNLIGVYRADVHCVLSKESWKWTELLQLLLVIPPRQLELQWKRSWLGPGRLKVPPGWTQLPQTRWEIGYVVATLLKNIRQHILGCTFRYMYKQYQTAQNTITAKMDA